jgi:hypothetical protein
MKLDFTIQVISLGKVASMTRTIQFDGEVGFVTKEIDDAISDRNLASEFQAAQFSITQLPPKSLLMTGRDSS